MQLLYGQMCTFTCVHVLALGMQTLYWLSVASLGQAITTYHKKQLGMTKISLPCDCVPMFGLLELNLTHFVQTIEWN